MIKLQCIGHLGQDATVNTVNGKTVINFSVAHSEKYKNKEGVEVNKSTWVSCAYWSDRINVAMYLKKGTQVYVEGIPEAKTYTSKTNEMLPQLNLRVISLSLLSSAKPAATTSNSIPNQDFLNQQNGFETTDEAPF
jgi:single-strand DNA-binding protein